MAKHTHRDQTSNEAHCGAYVPHHVHTLSIPVGMEAHGAVRESTLRETTDHTPYHEHWVPETYAGVGQEAPQMRHLSHEEASHSHS